MGKIDIISCYNDILVFTEVKTHTTGHGLGKPRSKINENKENRVKNAVQYYMETKELDCDFRFNVGEVVLSKEKPEIRIIEEALLVY